MTATARLLQRLYRDPAGVGSFSSAQQLWKAARAAGGTKITLVDVRRWLETQSTYTLYARSRKKFPTNAWIAAGLNSCHHADLAFFSRYPAAANDGYSVLLVTVDVLSRFICVEPLRTKHVSQVAVAYERLLACHPDRVPSRLVTDRGGEFCGRPFQRLLRDRRIQHIIPKNVDLKACYAENAIFRIKNKLRKHLHAYNTYRWIDVIQKIVDGLNSTLLLSIGMAPRDVTHENADELYTRLYQTRLIPEKPVYQTGDVVRISSGRSAFDKGTHRQRYTEELFRVCRVIFSQQRPCYILEDMAGEEIDAFYYPEELQRFRPAADQTYVIDKILKRRKRGRLLEVYVSFRGYPAKFNQWLPESSLSTDRS